jgi:hypothetical protein
MDVQKEPSNDLAQEETPNETDGFDTWYNTKTLVEPITFITDNGNKIAYCLQGTIKNINNIINAANDTMVGHQNRGCRLCRNTFHKMKYLRGLNSSSILASTTTPDKYPSTWEQLINAFNIPLTEITDIRVIPHDTPIIIGTPLSGYAPDGNQYQHVYAESTETSHVNAQPDPLQKLIHKYLYITTVMFTSQGIPGIHESLDKFILILKSGIHYGDKLLNSTEWFRRHIIEDFNKKSTMNKAIIVINSLLDAPYILGTDNYPISTHFHQMNGNVLDAMACAHNLNALKSLLNDRLSPSKYMQRSGEITEGNVREAEKMLGTFSTSMMTVNDAFTKYGAIMVPTVSKTDAVPYSSLQIKTKKTKNTGAAGLSARSAVINTLYDLIQDIKNNPGNNTDLYIDTTNGSPCAAYNTYGLDSKIKYKHLWIYLNGNTSQSMGITNRTKIIGFLPLPNRGVMIMTNTGDIRKFATHNCLLEEFLDPAYSRICGKVFMKLNQTMNPIIPSSGSQTENGFAIGVGYSASTDLSQGGKLNRPIRIYKSKAGSDSITLTHLTNGDVNDSTNWPYPSYPKDPIHDKDSIIHANDSEGGGGAPPEYTESV